MKFGKDSGLYLICDGFNRYNGCFMEFGQLSGDSREEIFQEAKEEGWMFVGQKSFCPNCKESMKQAKQMHCELVSFRKQIADRDYEKLGLKAMMDDHKQLALLECQIKEFDHGYKG